MVRVRFNYLIQDVRGDLLNLGHMVEQALEHAIHSLATWNATAAGWIIRDDPKIDAAQQAIEERVMGLLATQQPVVATDLRLMSVVVAIATELERIGDYACGIAKRIQRAGHRSVYIDPPAEINTMSQMARAMLRTSLEAFLHQDVDMARSLVQQEEQVDALEDRLHAQLLDLAYEDPQRIGVVVDLIDIVHVLERVADRATNIGERVIYLVTCHTELLNP